MRACAWWRRLALLLGLALAACAAGEVETLVVSHGGLARPIVLDRPADAAQPAPMIVVLHGAALDGPSMRGLLDGLPEAAREAGAAVAFPSSYGPIWNDGALARSLPGFLSARDDMGFLDTLLDTLIERGIADPARIHLVGISNGGMMAFAYACNRAERVASLIVFKATMASDAEATCTPSRPLPVLLAAGTEDAIVRWDGSIVLGGLVSLAPRLPVERGFAFWLARNGCAGEEEPRLLPRQGRDDAPRVERRSGHGCAAETLLYAILGGGHRLPGGEDFFLFSLLGPATPDADAVALILGFALRTR
jgi:polyhydroxybutyrate depolymerase